MLGTDMCGVVRSRPSEGIPRKLFEGISELFPPHIFPKEVIKVRGR